VGYDLMGSKARGETEPIPFETGKLGGKMERYVNMRVNPPRASVIQRNTNSSDASASR